jgi:hypothetical protein
MAFKAATALSTAGFAAAAFEAGFAELEELPEPHAVSEPTAETAATAIYAALWCFM